MVDGIVADVNALRWRASRITAQRVRAAHVVRAAARCDRRLWTFATSFLSRARLFLPPLLSLPHPPTTHHPHPPPPWVDSLGGWEEWREGRVGVPSGPHATYSQLGWVLEQAVGGWVYPICGRPPS